jgi:uncharacterized membrane protein
MDYNWFFSALAQSVATIVGIFGAYLITKIISRDAQFEQLTNDLEEMKLLVKNQIRRVESIEFDEYNRQTKYFVAKSEFFVIAMSSMNITKIEEVDEFIFAVGLSMFVERKENRDFTEMAYVFLTKERKKEIATGKYSGNDKLPIQENFINKYFGRREVNVPLYRKLKSGIINELLATMSMAEKSNQIKRRAKTFPLEKKLINLALIFSGLFFFVGVAYPLGMLPLDGNMVYEWWTGKIIILSIVCILYFIFLLVFYLKNNKQNISDENMDWVDTYSKYENYSPYYEIYKKHIENFEKNGSIIKEGDINNSFY